MNAVINNALSSALQIAKQALDAHNDWPSPASGLAWRVFMQAGLSPPAFVAFPFKSTNATQLRRTPELAAFGYVADKLDEATAKLWLEAFEHLRGRQIYPADRQSFVFNPIEVLGIASGLRLCPGAITESQEWFGGAIRKGIAEGQFRSSLPKAAAFAALRYLGQLKGSEGSAPLVDCASLAISELLLATGLSIAYGLSSPTLIETEKVILTHLLSGEISIGDAAEAAVVFVTLTRLIDKLALGSDFATPVDRIVGLCRRFPLLVEQLQKRQRERLPFAVTDEYDIQDLLHAVLKLHFDDVRPEEHTPSYAGTSSRVDFFLPRERVVVEVKMTRKNLGQKEVADELIIDAARYAKVEGIDSLICLVYDRDRRCANPKTLEADVESAPSRLKVYAVVCPQGL